MVRILNKIIWLFFCTIFLLFNNTLTKNAFASEPISLYVIGSLDRYGQYQKPPESDDKVIKITAAKNEWEGFQFIIRANTEVRNVNISVTKLKHTEQAFTLTAQFFRERFVTVHEPSQGSPYPPQSYPDILLPVRADSEVVPAEYRAFPQDLERDENIPIWGEVFVPENAPTGQYQGTIQVSYQGGQLELPIQLAVWNFKLPTQAPLRTVFGTNSFTVGKVYGFDPDPNQDADKNKIIRRYNDFLLQHHLAPEDLWDATPTLNWETKQINLKQSYAGLGTISENLRHYRQLGLSAYTYRFSSNFPFYDTYAEKATSQAYITAYADWCQALMGAERCYTDPSFLDEPDTPAAYTEVRKWGAYFDQIHTKTGQPIRFQVSEPPFASDRQLGSLYGTVDVWVGKFQDYWRDRELWQHNAAAKRLAVGEELWAYTALALDFSEYRKQNPQADALKGNYPPVWQLDYPPINYRLPTWLFHQYGITGLGYWDTLAGIDGHDRWNDTVSLKIPYSDGSGAYIFNGDGALLYPGFQDTTRVNEPLASLRLKWIRESVEDYMYMDLLWQYGEQAFVMQQVARLARNYGDWQNDPTLMLQIRTALGQRLHELSLTNKK